MTQLFSLALDRERVGVRVDHRALLIARPLTLPSPPRGEGCKPGASEE